MTIYQNLLNQGYKELAEKWLEKDISQLNFMMAEVLKNDFVFFSPLYIIANQLKSITAMDASVAAVVWEMVGDVLSEFPEMEQQSEFPFVLEEEAVLVFQQAMTGKATAILELATFYREEGLGKLAVTWYELAETMGLAEATYWLGNYCYDGEFIIYDLAKVFSSYEKAAAANFPDGINNLGDMYLRGEYVEQNDLKAFELFEKAAKLGVAESMYTLGFLYDNGRGTKKDTTLSKYWYHQSALHGDLFAINKMGHQAFEVNEGELAFSWYEKAAAQYDKHGEFNVGFCYESGIGVDVDLKKAKYWYQRAAIQGDEEAKIRLKELKSNH